VIIRKFGVSWFEVDVVVTGCVVGKMLVSFTLPANGINGSGLQKRAKDQHSIFIQRAFALGAKFTTAQWVSSQANHVRQ
jgi:hypothetical protein